MTKDLAGKRVFKDGNAKTTYISNEYGGRLCFGQYSYIWNYGKVIDKAIKNSDYVNLNKYQEYLAPDQAHIIRFVKVYDDKQNYCTMSSGTYPNIIYNVVSPANPPVELLKTSQDNLVLHYFNLLTHKSDELAKWGGFANDQQLYNIEYTIGTNNWGSSKDNDDDSTLFERPISATKSEVACKPPETPGTNATYCSVDYFSFVARAGTASIEK